MSKRERWQQVHSNLWVMPLIYGMLSIFLFAVTVWADLKLGFAEWMPTAFSASYQLTKTILSTLAAGILSLTAFTFYGIMGALTTFASQFSPRILKNFMINKSTQRTLGIFSGSFLYVLLCLLFLDEGITTKYSLIPIMATLLAVLSLGTFVFFVNHIVTWLQITNMAEDMKRESVEIIDNSLLVELPPYQVSDSEQIKHQFPKGEGIQVTSLCSGYLQTVDFVSLIKEAQKDGLVIQLEYKVGEFVFNCTPLLTYWKTREAEVDEGKYQRLFHIRKNQSELQDIEFSLNKFVEIAIRALGNDDFKTAVGNLYQIGDLLIYLSQTVKFTPYLVDDEANLRLILQDFDFSDYLYIGFASIRHYTRENVMITVDLLKVLKAVARGVCDQDRQKVWDFAVYTAQGFEHSFLYHLDKRQFYKNLFDIAEATGNVEAYQRFTKTVLD